MTLPYPLETAMADAVSRDEFRLLDRLMGRDQTYYLLLIVGTRLGAALIE